MSCGAGSITPSLHSMADVDEKRKEKKKKIERSYLIMG
jgi:hypothetical protein